MHLIKMRPNDNTKPSNAITKNSENWLHNSYKIVARVRSWTNNFLSYDGRLQLVISVLFATQAYSSSLLVLPKSVAKKVEQVLRDFLWKGTIVGGKSGKVA